MTASGGDGGLPPQAAASGQMQTLRLGQAGYPSRLAQTARAPRLLYKLGDADLEQPAVAIVGPRRAGREGKMVAAQLAAGLARAGVTVVSGMADGVDTAAHRGTLDAGGTTVAVLGSGVDVPYPATNASLHADIAAAGAVISEQGPGMRPGRAAFPRRNRIISGLSLGVVVVEAPASSGALITAQCARQQGRVLMAVPGCVLESRHDGCHELLRQGACFVAKAGDVIRAVERAWITGQCPRPRALAAAPMEVAPEPISAPAHELFALLESEPRSVDALAAAAQLPPERVLALLLELELAGRARRETGNAFVAAPSPDRRPAAR